jgi:hypothetical protein
VSAGLASSPRPDGGDPGISSDGLPCSSSTRGRPARERWGGSSPQASPGARRASPVAVESVASNPKGSQKTYDYRLYAHAANAKVGEKRRRPTTRWCRKPGRWACSETWAAAGRVPSPAPRERPHVFISVCRPRLLTSRRAADGIGLRSNRQAPGLRLHFRWSTPGGSGRAHATNDGISNPTGGIR